MGIHCSLLWRPPQAQVRVKLQEKAERRGYPDPAIMRRSIVGRMAEGKVQSRPHYVDRLSTEPHDCVVEGLCRADNGRLARRAAPCLPMQTTWLSVPPSSTMVLSMSVALMGR